MLNNPFSVLPPRAARLGLACVFAVGALAGCAQTPFSASSNTPAYVLNQDAGKPIQNERLNEFLNSASATSAATLSQSPWGNGVDVITEASYFAASGRQCRKLNIVTPDQVAKQALVCRTDNGWVEQRLVTQTAGSAR